MNTPQENGPPYTARMPASRTSYLDLSVAERIALVTDIWDSIALENPPSLVLTPAQQEQVRARLAAHERDPGTAVEWEQVRSQLLQTSH